MRFPFNLKKAFNHDEHNDHDEKTMACHVFSWHP